MSNVGQPETGVKSPDTLAAIASDVEAATRSADSRGSYVVAPEHRPPLNVTATGTITATGEIDVGTPEASLVTPSTIPSEKKPGDMSASVGQESSEGLGKGIAGVIVAKTTPLSQGYESGIKIPDNGTSSAASSNTGLESVDRVSNYPIVRRGYDVYLQAQEYNVIAMPLRLVKGFAAAICFPASMIATPLAGFCSLPLSVVDYILSKSLDVTEAVFPCLSVPPNQMIPATKDAVVNCVCCCPRTARRVLLAVFAYEKSS